MLIVSQVNILFIKLLFVVFSLQADDLQSKIHAQMQSATPNLLELQILLKKQMSEKPQLYDKNLNQLPASVQRWLNLSNLSNLNQRKVEKFFFDLADQLSFKDVFRVALKTNQPIRNHLIDGFFGKIFLNGKISFWYEEYPNIRKAIPNSDTSFLKSNISRYCSMGRLLKIYHTCLSEIKKENIKDEEFLVTQSFITFVVWGKLKPAELIYQKKIKSTSGPCAKETYKPSINYFISRFLRLTNKLTEANQCLETYYSKSGQDQSSRYYYHIEKAASLYSTSLKDVEENIKFARTLLFMKGNRDYLLQKYIFDIEEIKLDLSYGRLNEAKQKALILQKKVGKSEFKSLQELVTKIVKFLAKPQMNKVDPQESLDLQEFTQFSNELVKKKILK